MSLPPWTSGFFTLSHSLAQWLGKPLTYSQPPRRLFCPKPWPPTTTTTAISTSTSTTFAARCLPASRESK